MRSNEHLRKAVVRSVIASVTTMLAFVAIPSAASAGAQLVPATGAVLRAVDGRYVFWVPATKGDASRIVRRFDLMNGATADLYVASGSGSITQLEARAGRVAVLVDEDNSDDVGASRLLAINADTGGAQELQSVGDPNGSVTCGTGLGLAGITAEGKVIANDYVATGLPGGYCNAVRITARIQLFGADGAAQVLKTTVSQWLGGPVWDEDRANFALGSIAWSVSGDWYLAIDFAARRYVLVNHITGERRYLIETHSMPLEVHIWQDGVVFTRMDPDQGYYVVPDSYVAVDPSHPNRSRALMRKKTRPEFRACGEKLVEVHWLTRGKGKRRRVTRSRVAIRAHGGRVQRELPAVLIGPYRPVACDDHTLLLEKSRNRVVAVTLD